MPSMGAQNFDSFVARVTTTRAPADRMLRAALNLVDGAQRIRRSSAPAVDGAAEVAARPTEAVRAWLKSMEPEVVGGDFSRHAELREALVAAGEEVERAAAAAAPASERLPRALYEDALGAIGTTSSLRAFVPYLICGMIGGLAAAVLLRVFSAARR